MNQTTVMLDVDDLFIFNFWCCLTLPLGQLTHKCFCDCYLVLMFIPAYNKSDTNSIEEYRNAFVVGKSKPKTPVLCI